jgi:hypothetical protein
MAAASTVIIVGASRGIGASLAREFAQRGWNLGLLARSEDNLTILAHELRNTFNARVEIAVLDVTDTDNVAPVMGELMQRFGHHIDVIVANAGVSGWRRSGDGNVTEDRRIIETNLMGAIAVVDAAVAKFKQQRVGQIVGISSISAYKGIPGSAAYSASKAALTNYLDALRMELSGKNITITTVHPGFVKTDLTPNMEKYPFVAKPEKVAKEIVDGIQKHKKNIIVPKLPWGIILPVLKVIPDSMVRKIF